MTSTATGHRSFRHELFLYRSAEDLVEFVVPWARDGVGAEEPTLLLLGVDVAQAVLHEVGPSPYLTVEPALVEPGPPSQHVSAASALLPNYARVVHQEPVIAPSQWPEWRRLEAVLNLALRHYDTWAVCAYDQRTLTADMVERPARHPPPDRAGRRASAQRPLSAPCQLPRPAERRSARSGRADSAGGRARRPVSGLGARHREVVLPPAAARRGDRQADLRHS